MTLKIAKNRIIDIILPVYNTEYSRLNNGIIRLNESEAINRLYKPRLYEYTA